MIAICHLQKTNRYGFWLFESSFETEMIASSGGGEASVRVWVFRFTSNQVGKNPDLIFSFGAVKVGGGMLAEIRSEEKRKSFLFLRAFVLLRKWSGGAGECKPEVSVEGVRG